LSLPQLRCDYIVYHYDTDGEILHRKSYLSLAEEYLSRRNVISRLHFNIYIYIYIYVCVCVCIYIKGKAIPLQAWTGPEGSRRLRLPDFKKIGP